MVINWETKFDTIYHNGVVNGLGIINVNFSNPIETANYTTESEDTMTD